MQRESIADEACEAAEAGEDHFRLIWKDGVVTPEEAAEHLRYHRATVTATAQVAAGLRRGIRMLRRGKELPQEAA